MTRAELVLVLVGVILIGLGLYLIGHHTTQGWYF